MLRICDHPGCSTFTLGGYCPAHEPPPAAEWFPRGRPFPRQRARPRAEPAAEPDDRGRPSVPAVSFRGGT
jgi:hypothetical protein